MDNDRLALVYTQLTPTQRTTHFPMCLIFLIYLVTFPFCVFSSAKLYMANLSNRTFDLMHVLISQIKAPEMVYFPDYSHELPGINAMVLNPLS